MLVLNSQMVAAGTVGGKDLPVTIESLLELCSFGFAVCLLPEVSVQLGNLYNSHIFLLFIPHVQVMSDGVA